MLCQATGCDSAIYISEAELDHFLALIDGGKHEQENFRPVCSSCHRKKSAREHIANAKCKRVNRKHSQPKPPGKIKGRGFPKMKRKFRA